MIVGRVLLTDLCSLYTETRGGFEEETNRKLGVTVNEDK